MSSPSWSPDPSNAPRPSAHEAIAEHRARVLVEEHERARRRELQLADQRSSLNPPKARIQAWEKAHGLRLPADPKHPILKVIAVDTELSLKQVLEEQEARHPGVNWPVAAV